MHHEIMGETPEILSRNARFKVKTRPNGSGRILGFNGRIIGEHPSIDPRVVELRRKGFVVIEESKNRGGVNTFMGREVDRKFRGTFTRERANRAFKDYQNLRNAEQDRMGFPRGKEVLFVCKSFTNAVRRVVELVGPIEFRSREYSEIRLMPEYRALKEMGNGVPVKGFGSRVPMAPNRGVSLHVGWYIDADKIKGPHFNVQICPPVSIISDQGQHKKNEPDALNIAFCFPGGEDETFTSFPRQVQDALIADLDNRGSLTGYLPF